MPLFTLNGLFPFLPIAPPLCALLTHPFTCNSGGQRGTCVEPVVFVQVVLVSGRVSCFCCLLQTASGGAS